MRIILIILMVVMFATSVDAKYMMNPFTRKHDYYQLKIDSGTSFPADAETYEMFIRTDLGGLYLYTGSGNWELLHTWFPTVSDYLITEASDYIMTEGGDNFIEE